MLSTVVLGKGLKSVSQGVFYNTPVKDVYVKALTPPTLSDYIFNSNPTIHVYASALAKYQASSWAKFGTIVGDLEDFIDGIEDVNVNVNDNDNLNLNDGPVYDLSGRRVNNVQSKKNIYIQNGKKTLK